MKRFIIATALGSVFCLAPKAMAATMFMANLDGGQEVPPVSTSASGKAVLTLDDAQTRLEMTLELIGVDLGGQTLDPNDDVVGLHIHRGPIGANGPVVFGLINPNNDLNSDLMIDPLAGTVFSAWDLNEGNGTTLGAELPNLLSGDLYFNVHTPGNPSGELRGQIVKVPEPTATLAILSFGGLVGLCRRRRV